MEATVAGIGDASPMSSSCVRLALLSAVPVTSMTNVLPSINTHLDVAGPVA
jgi:hypothetical protein